MRNNVLCIHRRLGPFLGQQPVRPEEEQDQQEGEEGEEGGRLEGPQQVETHGRSGSHHSSPTGVEINILGKIVKHDVTLLSDLGLGLRLPRHQVHLPLHPPRDPGEVERAHVRANHLKDGNAGAYVSW